MQRPASIEDQTRNCREEAERNGWTVLDDYVRSDSAQSGSSLAERLGLISLLEDAKKEPRPFDCLLIDDTSRLGRNLPDVLNLADRFKHYGIFLYFVSQKLDSRDPTFRQLHTLNGMMDEQYLTGLADKVRRGLKGRILNGFYPVEWPESRIVSEEQWVRVQRQLELVNKKWGQKRIGGFNRTRASRSYLFSGLLTCGTCGGRMTITGGAPQKRIYGCFAHRYCGTCPNHLTIRQETLENQLIGALVNRIFRPDMLEHAIEGFYRILRQRLAELQKAGRERSAQSNELRDELERLRKQAENIVDAIAVSGHRQSQALLSRLTTIESQMANARSRLAQPKTLNKIPRSPSELRDCVAKKKISDLKSVLLGDRVLAKDSLRKHIGHLVLTPRKTPVGPVFDVSGDVDPFGGNSDVMLMVPGGGIEPPRTEVRRILSPLRLPVPPSRRSADTQTGITTLVDECVVCNLHCFLCSLSPFVALM